MLLGEIYRITLQWAMPDGGTAQNVFHYEVTIADPFTTPAGILAGLLFDLQLGFIIVADRITDLMVGDTAELALYDPILDQFSTIATDALGGFDGTNVTAPSPNGIAGLIKFFTDVGRSQGRKYIAGIVESFFTANVVAPALATDLLLVAAQWVLPIIVGTGALTPGNFAAVSGTIRSWTGGFAVSSLAAYQRRRKPGVGL